MNDGTFIKSKNNVQKMNQRFFNAVLFVLIIGLIKNSILWYINGNLNIWVLIKPFALIISSVLVPKIIQICYSKYFLKLEKEQIKKQMKQNRIWLYNILICLCMPLSIPFWIYIVSFTITVIYKIIEPKLYKIKINSTALGIIFIALLFQLCKLEFPNSMNYNLNRWIFGNEQILASSPLVLFISFIYLSLTKTIKEKISITIVLYSLLLYWLIGILCDLNTGFATTEVIVGSVFFLSIFVATDSITSPVTPVGQTLYSLKIVIITLIFIYVISIPKEISMGVAIILSNLLTPKLDIWGSFVRGKVKRYSLISLIIIIFGMIVAFQISRYI